MLTAYKRGGTWYAKGRVELNGRPITGYIRRSTGASDESGARDWIRDFEAQIIRGALLGEDTAQALTFNAAILLYQAKPKEAGYLLKVVPHLGTKLVSEITPALVRATAPLIYPDASTDTWRRQVLSPVSAVINNAHDLGKCPPIRIKGYSAQERIDQDAKRGKQSRPDRPAGDWAWIRAVQEHANPHVGAGLEFMFETGCRVSQMIAVRPTDFDAAACQVKIIAQKGHAAQAIAVSPELAARIAALPVKKLHRRGTRLPARVFGYADRTGFTSALRRACKAAGVAYLTPHEAGRHGFYTELRVRQGLDPISVAKAGRWSDPTLPDRVYAHADDGEEMRARIRDADPARKRFKTAR